MAANHAVFLREPLSDPPEYFAAIDVPVAASMTRFKFGGRGTVVSGSRPLVRWERHRAFDSFNISPDDSLRFGQCGGVVQIHGDLAGVVAPCFLMEDDACVPAVQELIIRLRHKTSFDTAGAQANLWVASYAEIVYPDFLGRVDHEFIERSRSRRPASRDVFLVEALAADKSFGVLELVEPIDDLIWRALIHTPETRCQILTGCELLSYDETSLDEISAVFRRPFATVVDARQ